MRIGEIEVSFRHSKIPSKKETSDREAIMVLSTECVVEVKGHLTDGIATCSINDNPCRDTGRKLSLKRALVSAPLNKDQREEIWEYYRTMTKQSRW